MIWLEPEQDDQQVRRTHAVRSPNFPTGDKAFEPSYCIVDQDEVKQESDQPEQRSQQRSIPIEELTSKQDITSGIVDGPEVSLDKSAETNSKIYHDSLQAPEPPKAQNQHPNGSSMPVFSESVNDNSAGLVQVSSHDQIQSHSQNPVQSSYKSNQPTSEDYSDNFSCKAESKADDSNG